MFRACVASCSRTVASSTTRPTATSLFHTSAVFNSAAAAKRAGSRNRKLNISNTEKRAAEAQANRPSVVLGTRPSEEETKWKSCDLYKILVKEEDLASNSELQPTRLPIGTVEVPQNVAFGLDGEQKRMILEDLPLVSAEMRTLELDEEMKTRAKLNARGKKGHNDVPLGEPERLALASEESDVLELNKAKLFAKVIDLRNANAAGIAFENRRRIIMAFSTPERPFDTGRAEVQAALLTYKIRNLWKHLREFRRDVGNRRGLTQLVHQRAKILRYLRKTDYGRYVTILNRLALEPEAVEGELIV